MNKTEKLMSKQIQITPEIEAQIRASIGDDTADVSKLAVFEARTLSTKPIKKAGGLFNGARVSVSTLKQMAELVNSPGGAIPIQIMHNTDVLPVGRVFQAKTFDMPTGDVELRTLFYIPKDKVELVNDIQNSVIDEVSVGLMTEHILCSECGFDFVGPESDFMNRFTATCSEGHVVGENGVHTNLVGVASWSEVSLVNRGAAKDAKILSRAQQNMNTDTAKKLAASGAPLESRFFVASYKMDENVNPKETKTMDKEVLALLQASATEMATVKIELSTATTALTAVKAEKDALAAKLASAEQELESLKAAAPEQAALLAAAQETQTKLTAAVDKLLPHVKAALVASGEVETDLEGKDLTAMLELVETKGYKLHQIIGSKPVSDGTKADVKVNAEFTEYQKEAFRTTKPTK